MDIHMVKLFLYAKIFYNRKVDKKQKVRISSFHLQ